MKLRRCLYCGQIMELKHRPNGKIEPPSEYKKRKYCSKRCFGDSNIGKNAMELICAGCGVKFKRNHGKIRNINKSYCSRKCMDQYNRGESHPEWKGGTIDNYTGDWRMNRNLVLERCAGCCEVCGCKPIKSSNLIVHHIYPYRLFEDKTTEAHQIDNLMALCRSCHGKAHREINQLLGRSIKTNVVPKCDENTQVLNLDEPCIDVSTTTNIAYDVNARLQHSRQT